MCPAWYGSAKVSSVVPVLSMRVYLLAGGDGGDGAARLHGGAERAGHASRSQAIACVRCVYSGPGLRCLKLSLLTTLSWPPEALQVPGVLCGCITSNGECDW